MLGCFFFFFFFFVFFLYVCFSICIKYRWKRDTCRNNSATRHAFYLWLCRCSWECDHIMCPVFLIEMLIHTIIIIFFCYENSRLEKDLWSVIESRHGDINCVIRCDVWQELNRIKTSAFSMVKTPFKKRILLQASRLCVPWGKPWSRKGILEYALLLSSLSRAHWGQWRVPPKRKSWLKATDVI